MAAFLDSSYVNQTALPRAADSWTVRRDQDALNSVSKNVVTALLKASAFSNAWCKDVAGGSHTIFGIRRGHDCGEGVSASGPLNRAASIFAGHAHSLFPRLVYSEALDRFASSIIVYRDVRITRISQ